MRENTNWNIKKIAKELKYREQFVRQTIKYYEQENIIIPYT